jgi:NAD(P)-dependent dehydrogenase (short-subunit alcohol dehydrogenase family)
VIRPGSGVVVTGAARGIGRAMAARLVAEGMRVVVNDIDADDLRASAEAIGAYAVAGDCASAPGVDALLDAARDRLGAVDVYVANAGTDRGRGLDTEDADWAAALEINTMAHVRAARALVPDWLERGEGRFVVTASAAGLLTMIGNAPYSVSKHAAVAFAEWLSATYRDRGIVVQVVCPQGVRTRMTEDVGVLAPLLAGPDAIEPDDVAAALWDALGDDRFLVLPHPEVAGFVEAKAHDVDAWLGAMNRLGSKLGLSRAWIEEEQ